MTTQTANSIARQKTLINGPISNPVFPSENRKKTSTYEYGETHATTNTNQKSIPPLNHPACRHDDQGRGSSKL